MKFHGLFWHANGTALSDYMLIIDINDNGNKKDITILKIVWNNFYLFIFQNIFKIKIFIKKNINRNKELWLINKICHQREYFPIHQENNINKLVDNFHVFLKENENKWKREPLKTTFGAIWDCYDDDGVLNEAPSQFKCNER